MTGYGHQYDFESKSDHSHSRYICQQPVVPFSRLNVNELPVDGSAKRVQAAPHRPTPVRAGTSQTQENNQEIAVLQRSIDYALQAARAASLQHREAKGANEEKGS